MPGNGISDHDILDLVKTTLYDMGPPRFEQIAQSLNDYEVLPKWFKGGQVKTISGSKGLERLLMTKYTDSWQDVDLYEEDKIVVQDLLSKVTLKWARGSANYAWERREVLENKGKYLIANLLEPRRASMMLSVADGLERNGWGLPNTTDNKKPMGIPYWVVKNASDGFNGGNPTGFSDCAGVNSTNEAKWRNYTATYSTVTKASLIKKMRVTHRSIQFVSPLGDTQLTETGGRGDRYRIYMNNSTYEDAEDLVDAQNDNLGKDLGGFGVTAGMFTFKKNPVVPVAYLDADTQNPVYFINHDTFVPVVLEGDYLRESDPIIDPKRHNVMAVFLDLSYNFYCANRRKNAVLYKA